MDQALIPYAGHPAADPAEVAIRAEDAARARQMRRLRQGLRGVPPEAEAAARAWLVEAGYTLEEMRDRDARSREFTEPRQALMWLLVRRHGVSLSAVGRFLDRGACSVRHGVQRESDRRRAEGL